MSLSLSRTSSQIANNASDVSGIAEETLSAATEGREALRSFVGGMEAMRNSQTAMSQSMVTLNQKIREDGKNLGPGFEIGHSYFVPTGDEESLDDDWYADIVRTQIEPLLREYWFDQAARVDGFVEMLLA